MDEDDEGVLVEKKSDEEEIELVSPEVWAPHENTSPVLTTGSQCCLKGDLDLLCTLVGGEPPVCCNGCRPGPGQEGEGCCICCRLQCWGGTEETLPTLPQNGSDRKLFRSESTGSSIQGRWVRSAAVLTPVGALLSCAGQDDNGRQIVVYIGKLFPALKFDLNKVWLSCDWQNNQSFLLRRWLVTLLVLWIQLYEGNSYLYIFTRKLILITSLTPPSSRSSMVFLTTGE